jgi:hypothetical protein
MRNMHVDADRGQWRVGRPLIPQASATALIATSTHVADVPFVVSGSMVVAARAVYFR